MNKGIVQLSRGERVVGELQLVKEHLENSLKKAAERQSHGMTRLEKVLVYPLLATTLVGGALLLFSRF